MTTYYPTRVDDGDTPITLDGKGRRLYGASLSSIKREQFFIALAAKAAGDSTKLVEYYASFGEVYDPVADEIDGVAASPATPVYTPHVHQKTAQDPDYAGTSLSSSGGGGGGVYTRSGFVGSQTANSFYTWKTTGGFGDVSQMNEIVGTLGTIAINADNSGWVVTDDTTFQGGRVCHINFAGGTATTVLYEVWKLPAQTDASARTPVLLGTATIADDATANKNYNEEFILESALDLSAGDLVAVTVRKTGADGGAGARMSVSLKW
jgi:hypothetical protein